MVFFIKVEFAPCYSKVLKILKGDPIECFKVKRTVFELFFHYVNLGPGEMAMGLVGYNRPARQDCKLIHQRKLRWTQTIPISEADLSLLNY